MAAITEGRDVAHSGSPSWTGEAPVPTLQRWTGEDARLSTVVR